MADVDRTRLKEWARRALAAACLGAGGVHADALYLGGVETSRHASYLYLGRLASLEHEQLQGGWASRLWLDRASYTYLARGQRYRGRGVSAEAGVGYLFGQAPFTGSVFVNLLARDTQISPSDAGSTLGGFHLNGKLSGDLSYQFSPRWSAHLGASYTPLGDAYWTRARLLWGPSESLRWGLEYARHGDGSYRARQTGLALEGLPLGPARWALKAGVRQLRAEKRAPYLGVDFSWSF